MPIEARSPRECFDKFREHVAGVVAGVLSPTPPILVRRGPVQTLATMSFASDQVMSLETRLGRLQFFLGQGIEAYERDGSRDRYTLRTRAYSYRLHWSDGSEFLRWEYVREHRPEIKDPPKPPRNHVHVHGHVADLDGERVELKKLHLPTGWTTFEDIVRFLITDLGVKPLDDNWPVVLMQSEKLFRDRFVPAGPWPSEPPAE